jgi:S-adenosylmethionine:tRNA ribosyltransferase-isomerase
MMVVRRGGKGFDDTHVKALPEHLLPGDVLVINDTRVFPARLIGRKENGAKAEVLLLEEMGDGLWRAVCTRMKRLRRGTALCFGEGLQAEVVGKNPEDIILRFNAEAGTREIIEKAGLPPLPPYIKRKEGACADEDRERYQTVYAKNDGSAAAPTAGLHLSRELLDECLRKGVSVVPVTLHVGLDTFSPVRAENILEHRMHGERYFISDGTRRVITAAKREGRRVIAVGTTSVRALESSGEGGVTDLFITPGHKFRIVDALLTNFHQPRSTLLILVSAFAGRELVLQMYDEAIKRRYRLFSYGDCMLIV